MPKNTETNAVAIASTIEADRAALQAVINRRLALRFGLTAPVAATVAALAGIGPREARR